MLHCRFLSLVCALAVGILARSPAVNAAVSPVWQPYRQMVDPPHPTKVSQVQHFVEAVPADIPNDAITDYQLNQLRTFPGDDPGLTFDCGDCSPYADPVLVSAPASSFELLPGDLLWHSYLAGSKEPRTAGVIFHEADAGLSLFDVSLGGRVSMLRFGHRQHGHPLGWELQIEGAAQLRLNLDRDFDFESADFRFGVPLIYAMDDQLQWKFAYYHLSSHVGDEFLERNPGFMRINYSRDVLVFGGSFFPRPAWRWYGEVGWAFYDDEGSDPWEFQFGVDYVQPGPTGRPGTPFVALNGHLREEVGFGGNFVAQAGWLWRGRTGNILRTGLHYYNGKSPQFEFFDNFEHHIGWGLWQEY